MQCLMQGIAMRPCLPHLLLPQMHTPCKASLYPSYHSPADVPTASTTPACMHANQGGERAACTGIGQCVQGRAPLAGHRDGKLLRYARVEEALRARLNEKLTTCHPPPSITTPKTTCTCHLFPFKGSVHLLTSNSSRLTPPSLWAGAGEDRVSMGRGGGPRQYGKVQRMEE